MCYRRHKMAEREPVTMMSAYKRLRSSCVECLQCDAIVRDHPNHLLTPA
jgi:hypothetical protein